MRCVTCKNTIRRDILSARGLFLISKHEGVFLSLSVSGTETEVELHCGRRPLCGGWIFFICLFVCLFSVNSVMKPLCKIKSDSRVFVKVYLAPCCTTSWGSHWANVSWSLLMDLNFHNYLQSVNSVKVILVGGGNHWWRERLCEKHSL